MRAARAADQLRPPEGRGHHEVGQEVELVALGVARHRVRGGQQRGHGDDQQRGNRPADGRPGRHRSGGPRQGPRPVRGRDEARALPVRRARRGRASRCSGCTPPARSAAPPASSPRRTSRPASTRRVLAVAFEKQSEGNAQFALGSGKGASLGAGGAFAPFIRAYIHRSGAPEHIGWKVAVKDRLNALEEPVRAPEDRGHLDREGEGVADDVGPDPVPRVVPVVRRRVRGGAHRRGRRQRGRGRRPPAGVDPRHVVALASRRASRAATRSGPQACVQAAPRTSTRRPASPTRASRSTWPSCTCRSRGTRRSGSRATTSPSPGEGWKMIDDGETALDRLASRSTRRGGVLSSNPIGASGLLRFAEAANQVRGAAGEHQVDGREGRARPWPTAPTASTSACGSSAAASSRSADDRTASRSGFSSGPSWA